MFELVDIIEIAAFALIASGFGAGAYLAWWLLRGVYDHYERKPRALCPWMNRILK